MQQTVCEYNVQLKLLRSPVSQYPSDSFEYPRVNFGLRLTFNSNLEQAPVLQDTTLNNTLLYRHRSFNSTFQSPTTNVQMTPVNLVISGLNIQQCHISKNKIIWRIPKNDYTDYSDGNFVQEKGHFLIFFVRIHSDDF